MSEQDRPVALVTGAARGIGQATALALAEAGFAVVASDLDRRMEDLVYDTADGSLLDQTVAAIASDGHEIVAAPADVRSDEDLQRAVQIATETYGRLDAVVANAGIASFGSSTWELPRETWEQMIDVTLTGTWNTCRTAIPALMEREGGGSIVIVSSTAAIKPLPTIGHYAAAKAGLVALMRSLALELAPHWIRVNTVHPGGTATPMTENPESEAWQASLGEEGSSLGLPLPIHRMEPAGVADVIAWLCSPGARYVTGTTQIVDAGATLQ
ncbi:SDR family oxidoreductase [Euzebya tangerina]|uniref:SDR family oxidoreductase n=1 Tax=Euzebya tangerina TaxID=591198 RepID=UPI000E31009F|nr:SDR family oxidoreductase [Euzebya tangerina]